MLDWKLCNIKYCIQFSYLGPNLICFSSHITFHLNHFFNPNYYRNVFCFFHSLFSLSFQFKGTMCNVLY